MTRSLKLVPMSIPNSCGHDTGVSVSRSSKSGFDFLENKDVSELGLDVDWEKATDEPMFIDSGER
jgi:hypothetical protein